MNGSNKLIALTDMPFMLRAYLSKQGPIFISRALSACFLLLWLLAALL